ncbi:MAG: phosphoribosylamine--glycine ligase [Acidobacteria bacterium RIFCSPLOWO2_12_FULL_67_14]|nr:MAG: phosphoribosylamine--glycine ligase [Acidobacteria bacterium RIFCSPLOWO2_12_FULL_67_14]
MRILVIGSGAREHALVWKLAGERSVAQVLCAPGNPGIGELAQCVPGDPGDPASLLEAARREAVDLTVVGPELPLSLGVVDAFTAEGRAILGPTRAAASLETSKAFAKDFMRRHGVPTAAFEVCDSAQDAGRVIAAGRLGYPLVLKADGLAAGKGVVIAEDRPTAEETVRLAMVERRFARAGDRLVLEQFLVGEEASYFVLADGAAVMPLSSAQDHKRVFDGDRGPNTGGMGAFAPSRLMTPEVERRVLDEIVRPVLNGMMQEGCPYRGFLYVGLMLTADGPQVVEFNVRLGDPEAQVLLPGLDEELSVVLQAAAGGRLPSRPARCRAEPHVGVVLAAAGYPETPQSGQAISGIDDAAGVPGALVFHAGTRRRDGALVTAGGLVLTVVGRGRTYGDAIDVAYQAASRISFEGMQYRRDIGQKALRP